MSRYDPTSMILKPSAWSVIVAGQWNPALFTPAGISKRLFKLPDATPIEVFVSLDAFAPPKVNYGGLTVFADTNRLHIDLSKNEFTCLAKAMALGESAIEGLPHTPVSAVGFNVRYRGERLPETAERWLQHNLDNAFSDKGIEIVGRGMNRALHFREGRINWAFGEARSTEPAELLFNFERRSTDPDELRAWLRTPIEEVSKQVRTVLFEVLGFSDQEVTLEELDDEVS